MMRIYLKEYVSLVEKKIRNKEKFTKEDIDNMRVKISFFQHERMIHLIVTMFFTIFTFIFMALGMLSYFFLIPFFIGIVFLIFYIFHYYFLENNVQYLYKLYDEIVNEARNK